MPAGSFTNSHLLRTGKDWAHNTPVSDASNFSHIFWEGTGGLGRERFNKKSKKSKLFFPVSGKHLDY